MEIIEGPAMVAIVPMKPTYHRLLIRAVMHPRVCYRPLVIESITQTPLFSYKILMEVCEIDVEHEWMLGGCDTYRNALDLLEQKVRTRKEPVLEGYFITVWPACKEVLVRDLWVKKKAAS